MERELLLPEGVDSKAKQFIKGNKTMTAREALIQAHIELGISRKEAELKAKYSDGVLPGAGAVTQSPVRPGMEREFIEFLKQLFRTMDGNSQVWQAMLRGEMVKPPDCVAGGFGGEMVKRAKRN